MRLAWVAAQAIRHGSWAFTTENSSGHPLHALPSMLTILTAGARPEAFAALDVSRFLHAGQEIMLERPLPVSGSAMLSTEVTALYDKGRDAIVEIVSTLRGEDAEGSVIGRATARLFIRGGGGFGGVRGHTPGWTLPDRPADARIVHHTRPEQALLYRLSGGP